MNLINPHPWFLNGVGCGLSGRPAAHRPGPASSLLLVATTNSPLLPACTCTKLNSRLWVTATDLGIEPHIMERILKYPGSSHFYLNGRIMVDLEVVLKVSPRGPVATRARHLMATGHCVLHP